MTRVPIPTWCFVLVLVRRGRQVLLVQERQHGETWYFPGGRVDIGETLREAALRETLEESGVPIVLDGIIRMEHTARADGSARLRVIFCAHAANEQPAKSEPDADSLQAAWMTREQLETLPLRSDEVKHLWDYVLRGGPVYPLSLLTYEGAPLPAF